MSRREQEEEHCGCTIDLSTGTVRTCAQCSRSRAQAEVQSSDQTVKNVQRARRVIR